MLSKSFGNKRKTTMNLLKDKLKIPSSRSFPRIRPKEGKNKERS
jgi:hypothetical protein